MKGIALSTVFAVIAVASPVGAAEPVATFVLDGTSHEFQEVSAFRVRDQADATLEETMVMLTPTAPNREAIVEARDPRTAAINDPATDDGAVVLSVDPDGTIGMNAMVGGVQYLDTTGEIFGEPGSLQGECAVNSETRIACTVSTPEPVEAAGDETWTFEAEFDTEVLKREAGPPVEPGGGPPGEALLALEAALGGDDLEAILAHLSESQADDYRAEWRSPEENLASVKDDLTRFLPSEMEVIGGEYVDEDEAELEVKGLFRGTEDGVLYTVTMVREGHRWVYDGSMFAGFVE